MFNSKAAQALHRALVPEPPRHSQSTVAVLTGKGRQTVNYWCSGRVEPRMPAKVILEKQLGIPVADWDVPAEEGTE